MKSALKNKFIVGLLIAVLCSLSISAHAAELGFFDRVKNKVISYYHHYYDKFFGEKKNESAKVSPQSDRLPASQQNLNQKNSDPVPVGVDPEKLATLPNYQTPGLEKQAAELKKVYQDIKAQAPYDITQGVPADATLRKTKSGVAVFDLYEKAKKGKKSQKEIMVKSIPRLSIGIEPVISQNSFSFELPKILTADFQKMNALATPDMKPQSEVDQLSKEKIEVAQKPISFDDIRLSFPKDINADLIRNIVLHLDVEKPVSLIAYTELTEKELDLLKGLIFAEYQDKCHLGTGFFKKLTDLSGQEKDLRDYYFGTCLFKQGFYTDAIPRLLQIVKRNTPTLSKNAIDLLLTDLSREYAESAAEAFAQVKTENIPEKKQSEFYYYMALGFSLKKEYQAALQYALKVNVDSKKYPEAQYIAAIAEYKLGNVKSSFERQERLLVEIDKRGVQGPLKSLTKMNLGRAAYRNKKYKDAIESYKFVGRENSLWIQSLTEQGWMQILAGDAPGAIGNMHSVQVPQFKDIYKPDSYVVRAIGYINICQYGDAKKSLDHLAKIYFPWLKAIRGELKKEQFNYVFYQNVIDALRTPANKTELAQPILREISRHKDFLNVQEAINNKVDEATQFGFIGGLIMKDLEKAKSRMLMAKTKSRALTNKIKNASAAKDTIKFVNQWKAERAFENDTEDFYNFEMAVIKSSFDGYKRYEVDAKKKIEEEKQSLKSLAGKTMKNRLAGMEKKLSKLMENNEFLTYEIFSGSGENIRYVSSGGQVKGTQSTRETASQTAPAGKLYLWDFDGEFWADEVGNYKSSLKDNCPSAKNLTQKAE